MSIHPTTRDPKRIAVIGAGPIEPGFFILGAKSYGTNSNFLMQVGHRQVRVRSG